MPRDGDAPLARFAHAIVRGIEFCFGEPQSSDDGSTVTVPVLRLDDPPRHFTPAHQCRDAISAVDTGRIDRLRVQNDSGTLVFLPPGSIFEGRGTASRATTTGIVLSPSEVCEVEVKCVQPSRPICAGKPVSLAVDMASDDLTRALLSRDQGLVWSVVSLSAPPNADPGIARSPGTEGRMCGRVLLDAQGVVSVEVYAQPDAWAAAVRGPSGRRIPSNPLGLNAANAIAVARDFIEAVSSSSCRSISPHSWVALDASAEFTVLSQDVVHLLAFGRDLLADVRAPSTPAAFSDPATGAVEEDAVSWAATVAGPGDADVAVAFHPVAGAPVELSTQGSPSRPRRRKVLTTGWAGPIFESLERYSHKEFTGDRSAAIRFLVREGLLQRGYLGPRPHPQRPSATAYEPDDTLPARGSPRSSMAARVQEYARIASTEVYADWLRKRARVELERLTMTAGDDSTRSAALSALDRLPLEVAPEAGPPPEEAEPEAPSAAPTLPPVDVRPLLRRAFAASASGRYPEALTLFDDVLTAEPDNRTALLGRAVALRRSGKAQDALDALDAVLRVEPANAAALLNRGRLLQERGDLAGALDVFDRLASVAPNDWDVWLVRGDVLSKMGRVKEALRAYAEALRRNPEDEGLKTRIRALESAGSAATPAPVQRTPLPRDVVEGQSYLVRESRPNLSLRALRALAGRGIPGLVVTRQSPEVVRRDVGLAGIQILELSHTPGEGRLDPSSLAALTRNIERFVRDNRGHGVIALDGLGTLVLENGSRDSLLFLERVHETVLQSHAVFLVSIAPGEFSDREVALLERSLKTLS